MRQLSPILACDGLGVCRLLPGSSQGSLQRLSLILHLGSTLIARLTLLEHMSHARDTYILSTLSAHMMVTWYTIHIASVDGTSMNNRQHCMLSLNGTGCQHTLPHLQGSYASSCRSISHLLMYLKKLFEALPVAISAANEQSGSHSSAFCRPPVHKG